MSLIFIKSNGTQTIQVEDKQKEFYLQQGYTLHPLSDKSSDAYKTWVKNNELRKKELENLEIKRRAPKSVLMMKGSLTRQIYATEVGAYEAQGYTLHPLYKEKEKVAVSPVVEKAVVAPLKEAIKVTPIKA